jgi:hypothetical protein
MIIIIYKNYGAMVKDLDPQCEDEGFKPSHLQNS